MPLAHPHAVVAPGDTPLAGLALLWRCSGGVQSDGGAVALAVIASFMRDSWVRVLGTRVIILHEPRP